MPKKSKQYKCKVCNSLYEKRSTTQVVCSPRCAIEKTIADNERKRKKKLAAKKQATKENDIKLQKKLTQQAANKLAVTEGVLHYLRQGRKPECISCQNQNPNIQYCGGHYKTRGGNPELALDIKNIFYQCNHHCNMRLSGNISGHGNSRGMTAGILAEYGQERLDYLNGPHGRKKYTCLELMEIRKEYNQRIRKNLREIEELSNN